MLPFSVQFKAGAPTYPQVVYAVKKAIIAGALRPGDKFPSVRAISQELKINPNTAQKVVAALADEGLLTIQPGIGTTVSDAPAASRDEVRSLLGGEVERLVVEAKRLRLEADDLVAAIHQHWDRL
jgi:DNA-binding transcriptional regulator YhcF (GntR family)